MERDSFTFKKEWRDAICELPKQVRAEVYAAIIEYGITGEAPKLKTMARTAFAFVKAEMDAMQKAGNGNNTKSRRGAPKGNRNAAKTTAPTTPEPEIPGLDIPAGPTDDGQHTPCTDAQRQPQPPAPPPNNLQAEIEQMAHDVPWMESMCMLFHLHVKQLSSYFPLFRTECETSGKLCHDGINDTKQHFKNWLRIQLSKKQQYEQSEKQRSLRRRNDVPDADKTDYHSSL